ncbi:BnaCnng75440D [Brassica napus]|uniref:BnaCnng75440D protein n=2 Tax=Brassica TaxID=3705 RepID=A0A078JZ76_BRANA|nr:BnaCnng75440D [Brassica napus]
MAGLLSHAPDATGSWSNLEPSLRCNKCVTPHITGVIRFCVELAVDDGKDSDTFVIFDKEMTRLTKQEVVVLAFEERAINNLLPLSEEEGGITTTSSNETVVAAKLGMGGETANPPGNKNVVNTHKHHRE